MTDRRVLKRILLWLFIGTSFMMLLVLSVVVCLFFYLIVELPRYALADNDRDWGYDSIIEFITKKKRMPENWEELMVNASYLPASGIETRIEINFDLLKNVNANKIFFSPTDDTWIYRFQTRSETIDQKQIIEECYRQWIKHCIPTNTGDICTSEEDSKIHSASE